MPIMHFWNFWYYYIVRFKWESTQGNNYVYTGLLMLQLWYEKG